MTSMRAACGAFQWLKKNYTNIAVVDYENQFFDIHGFSWYNVRGGLMYSINPEESCFWLWGTLLKGYWVIKIRWFYVEGINLKTDGCWL